MCPQHNMQLSKQSEVSLVDEQRHLWKHFEDFLVDVEDPTGIHFVLQLSSQRSVFLSGEQEGRGIATPRQ